MCSTEEGMSLPEINSPGYFQARGKRHLNSLKSKSPEHVSSFHCSEASMSKSEKEQVCDLRGAWPGVEKSVMDEFSYIFLIKKIKMNTYCIPWSVHRSSRDSLWPCCTLCSSLCTPRCDTWTSLDHYTESLQGGGRSRRKKNNLIQHLDVWVRIKTWKQGVQASCGCVMM